MPFVKGKNGNDTTDKVYTPDPIAKLIISKFNPTGKVLDAFRGKGAFYNNYPADVEKDWCEIDEGKDFFEYTDHVDWIITNPPYKYCTDFILKALELVDEGHKVAMFLKLTTLEGQDRYKKIFRNQPPIYIYSKRIQCGKNGEFTGTSAVCYAWFVWQKGFKGEPKVRWIN